MAEALVFLVIKKISCVLAEESLNALSSQLGKHVSLVIEAESSIKQIKSEFEVMEAFVSQTEIRESNNEVRQAWLAQVRGIAYEVEDTIDEYAYLIGARHVGFWGCLNKYYRKSVNVIEWHNLATRLKQIESLLRNLSEMKYRYSIKMTGESSASNNFCRGQLNPASYSCLVDDDDLVGIGDERKQLIQWLREESPGSSTVSVWGMGGLGKTTLVRSVYNSMEVKRHFHCHAWISVSQKYKIEDLLRRIIREFSPTKDTVPPDIGSMNHTELVEFLKGKLGEKRCLIVLDDVWSRDAWFALAGALSDNNSGSKVVITTRIKNVAELAIGGCVIELESLEEPEAWDLFCRRALCHEEVKNFPPELERWGRLIVEKCKGLPLAIVATGSLLSYSITEEEWRKFYERLTWELNNNRELNWIASILNLSYTELPNYLKNCFLYCSIFPEDNLIKRKRLIRLWIAEGFIAARGTQTLEEVAEDYLNELIDRCMLQVVKRNYSGRVKRCQMHDLTRDFTLTISNKENFCVACENPELALLSEHVRRWTVHDDVSDSSQPSIKLPGLRSFIVCGTAMSSQCLVSAVLCSSRFLRVLDLQNAPIEKVPDEVVNLFNLHYLGLRRTKVKELPRTLGRLTNLQTLDLWCSKIEKLPHGVTKLTKLRHLFAERLNDPIGRAFNALVSVPAPKGLCNLRELQTLQSVESRTGLFDELRKLTQLRSLRITKLRNIHCAEFCTSISNLRFLSHLEVCARDEEEILQLEGFDCQNQHLQKLSLKGRLDKGVVPSQFYRAGAHGNSIRWLGLAWSRLEGDPLPSLSHFSNLEVLTLINAYSMQRLWFRAGWFPNLTRLQLYDLRQLNWLGIERGAMARLHRLELVGLRELQSVPLGIEFLKSLQELYLGQMPAELKVCLQGRERSKVEHIPVIDYGV